MEMDNQQLTFEVATIKSVIQTMEKTLEGMIPTMNAQIKEATDIANDINTKLKDHVNPIVDAKVIETFMHLNDNHKAPATALDDKVTAIHTEVNNIRSSFHDELAKLKLVTDQSAAHIAEMMRKSDTTHQHLEKLTSEFMAEKAENLGKNSSFTAQLATMHAMTSSSTGSIGSGKKSSEPLVCHKLIVNKNSLSGEEDYEAFDEWYLDMADDFEILLPGAKALLKDAETNKERITMQGIMARPDSAFATIVSRELFSVLKKKTIGQARAQLKALNENEGLEALRLMRANLCRKDGQRLQCEFDTLTALAPIKLPSFKEFPTLHQRWESELTKFAAVDQEYRLGKYQRRNTIYRALPQEIKEDVDREQAHQPAAF